MMQWIENVLGDGHFTTRQTNKENVHRKVCVTEKN